MKPSTIKRFLEKVAFGLANDIQAMYDLEIGVVPDIERMIINAISHCVRPVVRKDSMTKTDLPKPAGKYGYTAKQIRKICRVRKIHHKTFSKAFGVNTCALDNGEPNYYACDIELALYKLGKGGKHHEWD